MKLLFMNKVYALLYVYKTIMQVSITFLVVQFWFSINRELIIDITVCKHLRKLLEEFY